MKVAKYILKMATVSTSDLHGSADAQVSSTQEESQKNANDVKLSAEDLKKTSQELSDLLKVEKSAEVRTYMPLFALTIYLSLS